MILKSISRAALVACALVLTPNWATAQDFRYANEWCSRLDAWDDVVAVQRCIDRRASVHATDEWGSTPLHWVADQGLTETVLTLIQNQADVQATDTWGNTPLHWAAVQGHTETARALIDAGADVDAEDGRGNTPLDWAQDRDHTAMTQLLIEAGAG